MQPAARFGMKWYWIALIAITVFSIFPFVSVLIASGVGEANGCIVNEAGVHPCMILGTDWGELLAFLGIMGWLMLVTFPIGFCLFLIWCVVLIIHRIAWSRRAKESS